MSDDNILEIKFTEALVQTPSGGEAVAPPPTSPDKVATPDPSVDKNQKAILDWIKQKEDYIRERLEDWKAIHSGMDGDDPSPISLRAQLLSFTRTNAELSARMGESPEKYNMLFGKINDPDYNPVEGISKELIAEIVEFNKSIREANKASGEQTKSVENSTSTLSSLTGTWASLVNGLFGNNAGANAANPTPPIPTPAPNGPTPPVPPVPPGGPTPPAPGPTPPTPVPPVPPGPGGGGGGTPSGPPRPPGPTPPTPPTPPSGGGAASPIWQTLLAGLAGGVAGAVVSMATELIQNVQQFAFRKLLDGLREFNVDYRFGRDQQRYANDPGFATSVMMTQLQTELARRQFASDSSGGATLSSLLSQRQRINTREQLAYEQMEAALSKAVYSATNPLGQELVSILEVLSDYVKLILDAITTSINTVTPWLPSFTDFLQLMIAAIQPVAPIFSTVLKTLLTWLQIELKDKQDKQANAIFGDLRSILFGNPAGQPQQPPPRQPEQPPIPGGQPLAFNFPINGTLFG